MSIHVCSSREKKQCGGACTWRDDACAPRIPVTGKTYREIFTGKRCATHEGIVREFASALEKRGQLASGASGEDIQTVCKLVKSIVKGSDDETLRSWWLKALYKGMVLGALIGKYGTSSLHGAENVTPTPQITAGLTELAMQPAGLQEHMVAVLLEQQSPSAPVVHAVLHLPSYTPTYTDACASGNPICRGNLGVDRSIMPQFEDAAQAARTLSQRLGVGYEVKDVLAAKLIPTQRQLDEQKLELYTQRYRAAGPNCTAPRVLLSTEPDGTHHIVDGHHNTLAFKAAWPGRAVHGIVVHAPIDKILLESMKLSSTGFEIAPSEQSVRDAAQDLAARAAAVADEVESAIRGAMGKLGELDGLKYRLKLKTSLQAKLLAKVKHGMPLAAAASSVKDALRFTVILPSASYYRDVRTITDGLKASPHIVPMGEARNYWTTDEGYEGIHTWWSFGTSRFEIQFHTRPSFDTKMRPDIHDTYKTMEATGCTWGDTSADCLKLQGTLRDAEASVPKPAVT